MPADVHEYAVRVTWTGNDGAGTADYHAYRRDHRIEIAGKPPLEGSADPLFLGDDGRWNPEELLVAALSACHKLWYLHLCADAGIVVESYVDDAVGRMRLAGGEGQFTAVILRPAITIRDGDRLDEARSLHRAAHARCFIARSVNFPVSHEPTIAIADRVEV